MAIPIHVLILEDRPEDAELMVRELRRAGFDPQWERVEREAEYLACLAPDLDLILADYSQPQFDALRALALLQERSLDIPCIVVTGAVGEEAAVECIIRGAADYLLKDRLARLGPAVVNALEQRRLRAERRRKNEELKTMTQQLWQMAKLATMGELAASVAHELNNPLATITLRIEGLLAQASGPARQALEVVEQEVERMARLVENLLNFSRRRVQQISSLDLCQEIDSTLELIQFHLRNHGIEVARHFAPALPLIQADRQQVRQLLLNLFTNASDAMPQGGVLTIRVHLVERGVAIEIADTGVGIAPENVPKVMEPFFTTKEEGKGTGLGLAICRRVMQEHGGTISIESQVGRGTTVRLELPVANGENAAQLRGE